MIQSFVMNYFYDFSPQKWRSLFRIHPLALWPYYLTTLWFFWNLIVISLQREFARLISNMVQGDRVSFVWSMHANEATFEAVHMRTLNLKADKWCHKISFNSMSTLKSRSTLSVPKWRHSIDTAPVTRVYFEKFQVHEPQQVYHQPQPYVFTHSSWDHHQSLNSYLPGVDSVTQHVNKRYWDRYLQSRQMEVCYRYVIHSEW